MMYNIDDRRNDYHYEIFVNGKKRIGGFTKAMSLETASNISKRRNMDIFDQFPDARFTIQLFQCAEDIRKSRLEIL